MACLIKAVVLLSLSACLYDPVTPYEPGLTKMADVLSSQKNAEKLFVPTWDGVRKPYAISVVDE